MGELNYSLDEGKWIIGQIMEIKILISDGNWMFDQMNIEYLICRIEYFIR